MITQNGCIYVNVKMMNLLSIRTGDPVHIGLEGVDGVIASQGTAV